MVNDFLEIASVFRSHGLTVRTIYPEDAHSRHEVLVNITEGGVMGEAPSAKAIEAELLREVLAGAPAADRSRRSSKEGLGMPNNERRRSSLLTDAFH